MPEIRRAVEATFYASPAANKFQRHPVQIILIILGSKTSLNHPGCHDYHSLGLVCRWKQRRPSINGIAQMETKVGPRQNGIAQVETTVGLL